MLCSRSPAWSSPEIPTHLCEESGSPGIYVLTAWGRKAWKVVVWGQWFRLEEDDEVIGFGRGQNDPCSPAQPHTPCWKLWGAGAVGAQWTVWRKLTVPHRGTTNAQPPGTGWQKVQRPEAEADPSFVILEFYTIKVYHFKEMNANYQHKIRKKWIFMYEKRSHHKLQYVKSW